MNYYLRIVLILMLVIASVIYIIVPSSINRTRCRANNVIIALEQYHEEYGYYPESLGDVKLAKYGPILVPCVGKQQWNYSCSLTRQYYVLSFGVNQNDYPKHIYRSSDKAWYIDN